MSLLCNPATGVSKAAAIVEWGAAAAGFRVPFIRYRGITFNRVGTAADKVTIKAWTPSFDLAGTARAGLVDAGAYA